MNYTFYDLDEEVKKHLNITLEEFVSTGTLYERDQIRCSLINSLIAKEGNKVIAVTPLSYIQDIQAIFSSSDILSIELTDSAENIFDRLVFSDENDNIYKDNDYKNEHMEHYLSEIRKDLDWYHSVYTDIGHQFDMAGRLPDDIVNALLSEYHLDKEDA